MSIVINEKNKIFAINTQNTSYAFSINAEKRLVHLYWGSLISDVESYDVFKTSLDTVSTADNTTFREKNTNNLCEYRANEPLCFDEPALSVTFADDVRGAWLVYESHKIENDGKSLVVTLKDENFDLYVELHYDVFEELDLINRYSVIINKTSNEVVLNKFSSATLHLKTAHNYRVTHYRGSWGSEYRKEQSMQDYGQLVIKNNHGNTSGPQAFPAVMMDEGGLATETSGQVYFATLHWSGDFKFVVEKNHFSNVNITAGINDDDSAMHLKTSESFKTPILTIGYTEEGFGKMSESLYDYQYNYLMPQNKVLKPLPVLYNAYCTYFNDIDEKKLLDLVPTAAEIGVELFVVDDGWMPKRTGEDAGLGDWVADKERFPNGLKAISDSAHEHNMLFGLWVEPEMFNPDSDLFREHEEWALCTPGRKYVLSRNQLVLNIADDEICDWAMKMVDNLIVEHGLDYLKWDMNRYINDFGFEGATPEQLDEIRIRYIKNVYRIWEYISSRHPDVIFENCAHGGARADYGMVPYTDRINRSDNHHPYDLLLLHEGFSRFFVPKVAGGAGNITHDTEIPFEFRKNMSFTGSFSLGFNLNRITDEEKQQYKETVAEFKKERCDLQDTYLYRIKSVYDSAYTIWEYVRRDRKVMTLFAFVFGSHYPDTRIERVTLTGLIKGAKYKCVNDGKIYTEEALSKIGVDLADALNSNLASVKLRFEIVE